MIEGFYIENKKYPAPTAFSCFLGFTHYENVNYEEENSNYLIFGDKVTVKGIYDGHLICVVKNVVVVSSRTGQKSSKMTQQYNQVISHYSNHNNSL